MQGGRPGQARFRIMKSPDYGFTWQICLQCLRCSFQFVATSVVSHPSAAATPRLGSATGCSCRGRLSWDVSDPLSAFPLLESARLGFVYA
eukprot:scaffold482_cov247-Pinguiococcus_pyrenoidosus.AAC.35